MIPNPIPEELRSDVLFITMGGNPAPNWVAARLLLKAGGKIYLLATQGVSGYATRLEQALMKAGVDNVAKITLASESDAASIYHAVSERVKGIKSGRVGLNYTGGTKAMAVHVYRAVERELQKELPPPVFSYLDARQLKMWIDQEPGLRAQSFEVRLAQESCLTLKGLYELHGQFPKLECHQSVIAAEALKPMLEVNVPEAGYSAMKQWWASISKTPLAERELPMEGALKPITECYLSKIPGMRPTLGNLYRPWGFNKVDGLAKWLEGTWLDDYTLQCVQNLVGVCDLNDYAGEVQVSWQPEKTFEMDVLALRGYQLFAISCQNSDKYSANKEHLIEVLVRARQLGGDEARVALVSMTKEQQRLQTDVRRWIDNPPGVRVFGRSDLPNLQNRLQEWFTEG